MKFCVVDCKGDCVKDGVSEVVEVEFGDCVVGVFGVS